MRSLKKFLFRLEPVLKHRSENEEKAIMAQALAQKKYQDELGVLEAIRQNLESVTGAVMERTTAQEILARSLYIDYLASSRARQEVVVENTVRELEKKRQAVVEARKDKLVLQKLKERSRRKYIEEFNRWEAKSIDDQCTVLSHRRQNSESRSHNPE